MQNHADKGQEPQGNVHINNLTEEKVRSLSLIVALIIGTRWTGWSIEKLLIFWDLQSLEFTRNGAKTEKEKKTTE